MPILLVTLLNQRCMPLVRFVLITFSQTDTLEVESKELVTGE